LGLPGCRVGEVAAMPAARAALRRAPRRRCAAAHATGRDGLRWREGARALGEACRAQHLAARRKKQCDSDAIRSRGEG
jgi:hypothetical protein